MATQPSDEHAAPGQEAETGEASNGIVDSRPLTPPPRSSSLLGSASPSQDTRESIDSPNRKRKPASPHTRTPRPSTAIKATPASSASVQDTSHTLAGVTSSSIKSSEMERLPSYTGTPASSPDDTPRKRIKLDQDDSPSTYLADRFAPAVEVQENSHEGDDLVELALDYANDPTRRSSSSPPVDLLDKSPDSISQRRVKVYRLQGESWTDLGTGFCSVYPVLPAAYATESDVREPTEGLGLIGSVQLLDDSATHADEDGPWIVVKAEAASPANSSSPTKDSESKPGSDDASDRLPKDALIWKSGMRRVMFAAASGGFISLDNEDHKLGYQRQQDTLIVWTEADGTDMALSFANVQGCADVWELVEKVRMYFEANGMTTTSSDELGPSRSVTASPASRALADVDLPEPKLGNLREIDNYIRRISRPVSGRDAIVNTILRTAFLRKLVQVHQEAEDLESLDDLHLCCILMQNILLLHDNNLFEYIMQEDIFLGIVGLLEYDPEFPTMKASYREHLGNPSLFREVVPFRDASLQAKIHQTYRLQYLKDVILARILDDPTFSMLNSHIFFNQVDIVQSLQNDDDFLAELFGIKLDPSSPEQVEETVSPQRQKQYDVISFLQAFCQMAKNLQQPMRTQFFRSLADRGILSFVEIALAWTHQPTARTATIDVLMMILEHDPNSVREHCLVQHEAGKRSLVFSLIDILHVEAELGIKGQMAEALKVLIQTPDMAQEAAQIGLRAKVEDPQAEKFLQYFYDKCAQTLIKPLLDLEGPFDPSQTQIALYVHLCDHLCFFVNAGSFRSKYMILSSPVSQKVAFLLLSKPKHLRLAALRYFRACIGRQDDFYNRYLTKENIFEPVLSVIEGEREKDNLVVSACLEFFEKIRTSGAKILINHLVKEFGSRIRGLALDYPTFEALVNKWEQINEPPPAATSTKEEDASSKQRPGEGIPGRALDIEEESWFNESSSDDEEKGRTKGESRKRSGGELPGRESKQSTPIKSPALVFGSALGAQNARTKGLVDYEGEDSDEEQDSSTSAPLAASLESPLAHAPHEEPPPLKMLEEEQRSSEENEDKLGQLSAKKRSSPLPSIKARLGQLGVKSGLKINLGGKKP
ncbi:uncharacterized protein L969DRAFT_87512 [Mixia osmundae IAM 14324]|uniref:Uncharacterized protein n=1 Tax=Mixia osmundae (strain CBS 9802 / IAM 14324 / JCM 22182 / KY 12970) TaxID=764103 RepID=G7DVJ1_MIXOS|nr:uncharacterized protein L969DRAFT_87512 [Mixia osmundae IAM 14324]KEI39558.1 hypothetical protein L969DRAFT_87512 [Mixia osmundae IAM 14324]GAA94601.1 hypothetical protein E5Q_01253 [Mixia osmundae IAM 14324]